MLERVLQQVGLAQPLLNQGAGAFASRHRSPPLHRMIVEFFLDNEMVAIRNDIPAQPYLDTIAGPAVFFRAEAMQQPFRRGF